MKYLFILISLLFFFHLCAKSQNLVSNPSFEIYKDCPDNYTTMYSSKDIVPDWYLPTRGTSDYFNSCSRFQVNVPNNFIGHMYARDGNAYMGIILIEKPSQDSINSKMSNYREYLQTELIAPLLRGERYKVKFNYAIATYSTYAVNNIGIYFSKEKIKKKRSSKLLNYSPQIKADTSILNTTTDIWFEVANTFIAQGGEKYLTIGNFYTDKKTQYLTIDASDIRKSLREKIGRNKIAYYYIDMISVTKIDELTSDKK